MLYQKIRESYRKVLYSRTDADGSVFYFSHRDFPGLMCEKFSFPSSQGHTLQGAFYYYEGYDPTRIVVFEHGMGSGHRGYMREIQLLAEHGYRVFAYDHTGCMESGGESIGGFTQSLCDLRDAFCALKQQFAGQGVTYSVVGHSWGGFSTLNICAFEPEITHLVAISGFESVPAILSQVFHGFLRLFRGRILREEIENSPVLARCSGVKALESTRANVLIIHSRDDRTVSYRRHMKPLMKGLAGKENVKFLVLNGKGHNPNYTYDALKHKDDFFRARQEALKRGALTTDKEKEALIASFDWYQITEQDPAVWREIFTCLDS